MPIRFRCVYCNQLLGIAHRKAGTVVRCPTCAGQVVVPANEAAGPTGNDPSEPSEPFLFEQNNFEQLFNPGAAGAPAVTIPSPVSASPQPRADAPVGAWGTHAEPAFDVEQVEVTAIGQPGTGGVFLSSAKATVLSVVWIVTLVAAFGIGLLIGLAMRPAPQPEEGSALLNSAVRPV